MRSCDKIVDEKTKKKSENQSVTARKRRKKKKETKINLGIDWNQDKKLSLSNLMIIRKQIKTKKSLINDLFFLLLFFLFCLVLCLIIVIWAILPAKPDYATRPLLLLLYMLNVQSVFSAYQTTFWRPSLPSKKKTITTLCKMS